MIRKLQRHKWWVLLAVLLLLNAIHYWPKKHPPVAFGPGPRAPLSMAPPGDPFTGPPEPNNAMRERMEAMVKQMPEDQRKAFEDRMAADRAFFESLRDLPADQRREKMQEHFAQNPPPPGFAPGGPGSGNPDGPGGPGNFEPTHLPPPEVRQGMDAQIANTQKKVGGS